MQFGDYRVEIVPDTEFWLDGGAMFGVVPRELWSRVCPPDDRNRIRLNMNCLFIEAGDERILIDTGIGDKWSPRQAEIYGIDRKQALNDSLREYANADSEDVTIVINTHLHFDHAGGNTARDADGRLTPAFPNARYFVSRSELAHAEAPHERDRASYLPENWQPLRESGQLELKDESYEVVPGLAMQTIAGHSRTMQIARLDRGGKTLFAFADLVPTRAHVRLPWIMGFDLYPVETLEAKKRLLPSAANENWVCHFYHDPDAPLCRISDSDGIYKAEPIGPTRRW
jgi:glyoxylase-like metal-dependent hydrolase (beta-lactamase superfamily II)